MLVLFLVCKVEVRILDLTTEGQILNLFLGFGLVLSLEISRPSSFKKGKSLEKFFNSVIYQIIVEKWQVVHTHAYVTKQYNFILAKGQ